MYCEQCKSYSFVDVSPVMLLALYLLILMLGASLAFLLLSLEFGDYVMGVVSLVGILALIALRVFVFQFCYLRKTEE